jgi:hypothetical protein
MIPSESKAGKKQSSQLTYKGAFVGMSTSFEKPVKKEESITPASSTDTPNKSYRPRADYLSRLGISKPGEVSHSSR